MRQANYPQLIKDGCVKMKGGQRLKLPLHPFRRHVIWGITVLVLVFSLSFALGPNTATDTLGILTDILISGLVYGGLEYLAGRS